MNGLLTIEDLLSITNKSRPHCQKLWFQKEFGVDLPCNRERVILSWSLFGQLECRRAGLSNGTSNAKPKIYSSKDK